MQFIIILNNNMLGYEEWKCNPIFIGIITKHEFGWMVVHWFSIGMVMALNIDQSKLNFIFAKIFFEWIWKGRKNPSHLRWAERKAGKPS